jgi:two-component system, chemotaxis family, protein-glutamate methylesterase/glutaminase
MPHRDLIVMGASAGGVTVLSDVVAQLPPDLPAAILTVLHMGPGRSALPEILRRSGRLPATHPKDGEAILPGHVYAAPPDWHLLVEDSAVRLHHGPKENGHRPAVDVLFRSAARVYRRRVIGVVLTGNLDDGTAGLLAIKKLGGVAVVQDPAEADYPSMPRSAIENVPVDYVVPIAELGALLDKLVREPLPEEARADFSTEDGTMDVTDETLGKSGEDFDADGNGNGNGNGKPSGFTCPDCGGALWEWSEANLVRFRCRTGHAYSPESLDSGQSEALEVALWAALRSLEERASLQRHLAMRMEEKGSTRTATGFFSRAEEAEKNAALLRQMLSSFPTQHD